MTRDGSHRKWPPTVIVVHPKENRAKCTLEPLRGHCDMQFCAFSPERPGEFPGYVRLSVEGPALTAVDANSGILLIDGAWRHADRVQRHFSAIPSRSLQGFRTAYPRVSKLFQDPAAGLASVEALFVAYRILGRPTEGLLNHYYWREAFLRLNGWWPADGLSPQ